MYGFNFSSFTSQLPRACSITSFESPTTSTTLAPAAINDSKPRIQASYSAILLVTGNINFLQIVTTSPLGVSNTTPAPAPFLFADPSKNNFQTSSSIAIKCSSGKDNSHSSVSSTGFSARKSATTLPFTVFLVTNSMSNSDIRINHLDNFPAKVGVLYKYCIGSILETIITR